MSFLDNLKKLFTGQPLSLQMKPARFGVQAVIKKGDQIVDHQGLLKNKAIPDVLMNFLRTQPEAQTEASYLIPLPASRQLSALLKSQQSTSFNIDITAIEQLREVEIPSDFNIHWQFEATTQLLRQVLKNADGYLGGGWFYRSNEIWHIDEATIPNALKWFATPTIASNKICDFVTQVIHPIQSPMVTCDLVIGDPFEINLSIVKVLKRSVDFKVVSNMPEVQNSLTVIGNDPVNLISGNILFPRLGLKLKGRLLHLTRVGDVERISGDDLLRFIQDDLRPNAQTLGIDLTALTKSFHIEDAGSVPVIWELKHEIERGLGRYKIVPCMQTLNSKFPISTLMAAAEKGQRFVKIGDGWLELTSKFQERNAEWHNRGIKEIVIGPLEVMGVYTGRLDKLGLTSPVMDTQVEVAKAVTEGQKARALMDYMNNHGLPVGIFGLQKQITGIIGDVCSRLFQKNPQANILWLAPNRKKDEIVRNLQHSNVSSNQHQPRRREIFVASPDMLLTQTNILTTEWSLVIFSDLDVVVASDKYARILSSIRREWSIATFNRVDWHKNNQHVKRGMEALRLSEQGLTKFLEFCYGVYRDEGQNLLSRLISPFRTVTIPSSESSTNSKDVPIPPRPEPKQPTIVKEKLLGDIDKVYRPSFDVPVSISSSEMSFLGLAEKYADQEEGVTEHVPFMSYWPSYEAMTPSQRKWYFYWRSQVRNENYLPTDLSYLYLHIYEVIHRVGFSNAEAGSAHLINLWRQYRTLQPKLDTYLVDWIADFHAVYELPQAPLDWYSSVLDSDIHLSDTDLAIEAWLSRNDTLEAIPDSLLLHISNYQPAKSKFVQQYNHDASVNKTLRKSLHLIDDFLQANEGKSLFEQYRPQTKKAVRRLPFAGAVYEGKKAEVEIAKVFAWSETEDLRVAVTSILKYTENLLRRQHNFKGTLRGVEITPTWCDVIDHALKPVSSVQQEVVIRPVPIDEDAIVIDLSKASALAAESAQVRERLIVMEDEAEVEEFAQESSHKVDQVLSAGLGFNLERPEDTPDGLLTELQEVYAIIAGDYEAIDLLRELWKSDWQVSLDMADSILDGVFLNVVLDRINERALDEVGDQLIFEEGDLLVVTEDYRDELEYLLGQSQDDIKHVSVETPEFADLTPEWASFVSQMQKHHWETINVLLLEDDVSTRLDGIARSIFSTIDLLIDEINEFALVSIGDIVIETGNIPAIEEEDIEDLRSLMVWAQQNIIQEL